MGSPSVIRRYLVGMLCGVIAWLTGNAWSAPRTNTMPVKIIVTDEAFSMLDVSMRSQVVNLLLKLQERLGLSYVVVANDLGLVRHISDKVLIMHQGEIVEQGLTRDVFANPQHEVTKRLIQNHGHEYRR